MRRLALICAAAASLFAVTALAPPSAQAMPVTSAEAVGVAQAQQNLAENVAYYCRRVWRCGPYGCGWRRACGWTPGGYYGYGGYGFYRPYYHRYGGWHGGWHHGWHRRHW